MSTSTRVIVAGVVLAVVTSLTGPVVAAQFTFNIPTAEPFDVTVKVETDSSLFGTITNTQRTYANGHLLANVSPTVNAATRQISAANIAFVEETPGGMTLDPMTFSMSKLGITETVQVSKLNTTPKTPSAAPLTFNGIGYDFPLNTSQLVVNQGTVHAEGISTYDRNFADPGQAATSALNSGTGTLTFVKTTDTLTSLSYTMHLNVPVAFDTPLTSGSFTFLFYTVNYTVSMSGSGVLTADSSTTSTQNFGNFQAYWDTSATTGLQAGSGTWDTTGTMWNTASDGSGPRYAWTADAGTVDAVFNNTSGAASSVITVPGTVATRILRIMGTGYSFAPGGTITLNGGIMATQSATIGCNLALGANQAWTASAGQTLTVNGDVDGSGRTLTVRNSGSTIVSGNNTLGLLKVGDSAFAGNLTISGGKTTAPSGLLLNGPVNGTTAVNLTGGILAVGSVGPDAASQATTNLNCDGGTLQATTASPNFMSGLTHAFVKEGGAIIDTQNFDVTIGQLLEHGGAASIDGGLTKTGPGTLTIAGDLTYTGPTRINDGTLLIDNGLPTPTTLGAISGPGELAIAAGSILNATSITADRLSIGVPHTALAAVPEPAAATLLAIAGLFAGLAGLRCRREPTR